MYFTLSGDPKLSYVTMAFVIIPGLIMAITDSSWIYMDSRSQTNEEHPENNMQNQQLEMTRLNSVQHRDEVGDTDSNRLEFDGDQSEDVIPKNPENVESQSHVSEDEPMFQIRHDISCSTLNHVKEEGDICCDDRTTKYLVFHLVLNCLTIGIFGRLKRQVNL